MLDRPLFLTLSGVNVNKQSILAEIKRTTLENGGVPLGRQRFQQETGIKESDWYGRYWATWSEAVAEAGLQPNKLNEAYAEGHLLDAYANLVRELGHLPR